MKRTVVIIISLCVWPLFINCNSNTHPQAQQRISPQPNQDLHASSSTPISGRTESGERVSFSTSDGVIIVGTLYKSGKEKSPVVLCLHQWMSDKTSYGSIADKFVEAGISVLAIDMRGFGESIKKTSGKTVESDRLADNDVDAAIQFIKNQKSIDPDRIGILGASYGASNALIYASNHPGIKATGLLSPGLNYFNVLPTEDVIRKFGDRPLMSVAMVEDRRSTEAVKFYQAVKKSHHTVLLLEGSEHGTNMFATDSSLGNLLVDFFVKNL